MVGVASLSVTDIHNMTNQDLYPIVFNMACNNGNLMWPEETMIEAWTLTPGKGAVAAVAAAEWTYYAVPPNNYTETFDTTMWSALDCGIYNRYMCTLGYAHFRAKLKLSMQNDPTWLHTARVFMLDGDPELARWWYIYGSESPIVQKPSGVGPGQNTVTIRVLDNDYSPIYGAYVILYKKNDVLDVSKTDFDGYTVRNIYIHGSGGKLSVVVKDVRRWPYETSIPITYHSPYSMDETNNQSLQIRNVHASRNGIAIEYQARMKCLVNIKVFDITGRMIAAASQNAKDDALNIVHIDPTMNGYNNFASGVYFCILSTDNAETRRKIVVH